MAKVYGQDIPSKHFDTYHNFFARSYDQSHQPYGKSVKKSNWDFPGYPYHPHFPSPGQLYVRAVFKSATICWHLQPDAGGDIKPDVGPIPREWWEKEADKDRTFGYRKFMSDTLLQKFRVGEPTWCIPHLVPATWVCYDFPDTNWCNEANLFCNYRYMHRHWWIYMSRPPEDYDKEFLYLYCHHVYPMGSERPYIMACLPEWFVFDPCTLTWNTRPGTIQHLSKLFVTGTGWHRFFVGPYDLVYLRPYFDWFDVLDPNFYGGVVFYGPKSDEVDKRPFYSFD